MFGKIGDRFKLRSRRGRVTAAAAICAAGLVVGFGGSTLLAQLKEGNPTPQTEATTYCEYVVSGSGFILDPTCGSSCGWGVGWQLCYDCQSPCPWNAGMTIQNGCCYYPVNLVNTSCVNCQ